MWPVVDPTIVRRTASQESMETRDEDFDYLITNSGGSMPFPVEIDFSANVTVAAVLARDSRHQGVLR